jgi:2-C-methyl-D-erythritol 2,4-cyclodiphosphate synthase
MRFGIGFDIHPLVSGRKLVLGGMEIPFDRGLDGWSDADVLTHAIIDALLGAAAMGDIGMHFPPGKAEYKNISSLKLLTEIKKKLTAAGWQINNIVKASTANQVGPLGQEEAIATMAIASIEKIN